jgi:hypothetical protein
MTGAGGGVADSIALTLRAASVEFIRLSATNVAINASGPNIAIANGHVSGRMAIATPSQLILLNNASARPTGDANVQLFQPTYDFSLNLQGRSLSTNSYVVDYRAGSNVTNYLGGVPYDGASLVRDFARIDRAGAGFAQQPSGDGARSTLFVTGTAPGAYLDIQAPRKEVQSAGQGPAVNVGQ